MGLTWRLDITGCYQLTFARLAGLSPKVLFGIMRECERILKRRGVNVYPCLIPSMQKLTKRGIELANKFRKLGVPVIESYPGAAQDILAIPRKRAGLQYLADALVEFGIFDNFTKSQISHDELDAITSAIVGLFFWTGKFEAIGNLEEEYLIIPDLSAKTGTWTSRKIYGLSGEPGSGKTTVGKFLKFIGFSYSSFNPNTGDTIENKNGYCSPSFKQHASEEIHTTIKHRYLFNSLFENLPNFKNLVIDSIDFPEDHAFMVEKFGPSFRQIYIEAPPINGKDLSENSSLTKATFEPNQNLLRDLSDIVIENNSDIEGLFFKIVNTIKFYG